MIDFTLSPEHTAMRDTARAYTKEKVSPVIEAIEEYGGFPRGLMDIAAQLGLLGIIIPDVHGGAGSDTFALALIVEEISKVSPALALIICANNSLSGAPIVAHGNQEQKDIYLPQLALGTSYGCYAMTEPGAGSDVAGIRARARMDGDSWVLNGTKAFITNGSVAGIVVGIFRTNPHPHRGLSAFIIDTETPGFRVGRIEKKMGLSCSPLAELVFEDCIVPKQNLLGNVGDGFKIAMQTMNGGRIYIAAQALGIAEGALELAVEYSKNRRTFGRPLAEHQAVAHSIAESATEIELARSLIYRTCAAKDGDAPYVKLASMSKLFATEMACRVVDRSLQIFGGTGYIRGNRIERLYRDVRALPIYEGASAIQKNIIANAVIHGKFES